MERTDVLGYENKMGKIRITKLYMLFIWDVASCFGAGLSAWALHLLSGYLFKVPLLGIDISAKSACGSAADKKKYAVPKRRCRRCRRRCSGGIILL